MCLNPTCSAYFNSANGLSGFKARAETCGGSYQTMMNEALKQYALGLSLADVVRETIRKEMHSA